MTQSPVTEIYISQDDFNFTKSTGSTITVVVNYYDDDPAGYEILLAGMGGTKAICARPCPIYNQPQ